MSTNGRQTSVFIGDVFSGVGRVATHRRSVQRPTIGLMEHTVLVLFFILLSSE